MNLSLEGAVELVNKRVEAPHWQDPPLRQDTFHIVVSYHRVFLENLYSVHVIGSFLLSQQYLPRGMCLNVYTWQWILLCVLLHFYLKISEGSQSFDQRKFLEVYNKLTLPKLPIPSTLRNEKSPIFFFANSSLFSVILSSSLSSGRTTGTFRGD